MMPLFGRTQYLRGAVVLTLKQTFLSVGLLSFRVAVTTSVNGPEKQKQHSESMLDVCERTDLSSHLGSGICLPDLFYKVYTFVDLEGLKCK